jgi:hypothetical protein
LNAVQTLVGGSNRRKKILFLIVGLLLLILGVVAIAGGIVVVYFNTSTDAEGYALSTVHEVRSSANAYVLWVSPMRISSTFSWVGEDISGTTKWVVKAVDGGKQVFAGWTEASEGSAYVENFRYETPDQGWHWWVDAYYAEINVPSTKIVNQGTPVRVPAEESLWIDSAVTVDTATIYWNPRWEKSEGMKMIILMNADGSSGVNADLQFGYKVPILTWLPYLLIPMGVLLCVGGYLVFRRRLQV